MNEFLTAEEVRDAYKVSLSRGYRLADGGKICLSSGNHNPETNTQIGIKARLLPTLKGRVSAAQEMS